MLTIAFTLFGLFGSETAPLPLFAPLPDFGLIAPFSAGSVYFTYGESSDGRYLIRNAWDPHVTTLEFYGMPVSVDTWTGDIARLDLTNAGENPLHQGGSFDQNVYAMSADTRFIVFRSDSKSYGPISYPQINPLYWLDRDTDEDGVFDEIDARRVVRLGGMGSSNYDFGSAAVSDDGRYVVFDDRYTAPIEPFDVFAIYLADLDADSDGVLGEEPDVNLQIVSEPLGIEHSVTSYRPTLSADGRFIAFTARENSVFLGYEHVGYFPIPVYDHPPGHPLVERVTVLDRDEDEDGIFDETALPKQIDVTAQIGPQDSIGPVYAYLPRDRKEVLFTSPQRASFESNEYSTRLLAFDFETERVTQLLPTTAGLGFGRTGFNVRFGSSADGRRVHFNTTELAPGALNCPEYANSLAVLDRDVDADGEFDEPTATTAKFITSTSIPKAAVVSASPNVDRFVWWIDQYQCPGQPSMYGFFRYDESCHGSITFADPIVPEAFQPQFVTLGVDGCPQPEGHLLFDVGSGFAVSSMAWLEISATDTAGTSLFAVEASTFVPIPLDLHRFGMKQRGTLALQVPASFPASSFIVRALAASASTGQLNASKRIRIQTP